MSESVSARPPSIAVRGAALLVSLTLVLILVKAMDLAVAPLVKHDPHLDGLVFPPHSTGIYETTEFRVTAEINSLGFRDREFSVERTAVHRIVALGDSFTYGWGVGADLPWPKALERTLQHQGLNVEVANLGYPGAGAAEYADVAEKALPALRPDLVLVGVLQGDDLEQSDPARRQLRPSAWRRWVAHPLPTMYPNLTALSHQYRKHVQAALPPTVVDAASSWRQSAPGFVASLSAEEKARYQALAPDIRNLFLQGRVNGGWLSIALHHPDYYVLPLHPETADMQARVQDMAIRLGYIKASADAIGARVLVVSVPSAVYTCETAQASQARMGYQIVPLMLTSTAMDDSTQEAAQSAGVDFVSVTPAFREAARYSSPLFFPLDGHLNAQGHARLAELLAPTILAQFKQLADRR